MTAPKPAGSGLVRDSSFALAGRLASITLSLAMAAGLVRLLGQELYGAWSLLAVVLTASSVIDFGLPGAVERQIAECRARDDAFRAGFAVSAAVLLIVGATLAAEGVVLLWPTTSSTLFERMRAGAQLLPAAFSLGLIGMVFGAALTGLRQFYAYHLWRTAGLGVGTAFTLALAWWGVTRLDVLVSAYACGSLVTLLGCLRHLRSAWPQVAFAAPPRKAFAQLASFGGALQTASLAPLLSDYAFRLLVAGRFGAASIGLYDIASRVSIVVRSLAGALASSMVPYSIAMLADTDRRPLDRLHGNAVIALALFTLPATAMVLLTSGPLATAMVGSAANAPELQWTMAGLLAAHLLATMAVPGLMLARAARMPWAEAIGATGGGLLGVAGAIFLPSLPLAATWLWTAHAVALLAAWRWNAGRIGFGLTGRRQLWAILGCFTVSAGVGGAVYALLGNHAGLAGWLLSASLGYAAFGALLLVFKLVPDELTRALWALAGRRAPAESVSDEPTGK